MSRNYHQSTRGANRGKHRHGNTGRYQVSFVSDRSQLSQLSQFRYQTAMAIDMSWRCMENVRGGSRGAWQHDVLGRYALDLRHPRHSDRRERVVLESWTATVIFTCAPPVCSYLNRSLLKGIACIRAMSLSSCFGSRKRDDDQQPLLPQVHLQPHTSISRWGLTRH